MMETAKFTGLIRLITGRDFSIQTADAEILPDKEYLVYRVLPISGAKILFRWKSPKNEDKTLRSFITAFSTKYREPNPANYTTCPPYYAPSWEQMTPEKREHAYMHHPANMYSKESLMEQVEQNLSKEGAGAELVKYGFYATNYGIGIFSLWWTNGVDFAVKAMKEHLYNASIPFSNEFSEARWVYRFKINLTKDNHMALIHGLGRAS